MPLRYQTLQNDITRFYSFLLLMMFFVVVSQCLAAADFAAQTSCPVCKIDFPTIVAATETSMLAIDGQPLNTRFLPLPECPLCGGVFDNITLSSTDLRKLEDFIWAREQQNDRQIDTRLRFAKLLEQLERDSRQIGLAYLQAAWANSGNQQLANECREKSLRLFKEYLESPDADKDQLFDVSLKTADILRQLQLFTEAEAWLKQMQTNKNFQQAWYPVLVNHTLELVRIKNHIPAALPTGNRLHNAIAANELKTLSALLNQKRLLSEIDTTGLTPLLLAINIDNNAAAVILLKAGADPLQTDTRGNSPLHLAAQRNNREILQLLLERSTNVDPVNQLGQTPLHVAIETLNPQIAGMLINAGASLNRKDSSGNNLLHMVCQRANPQYEKILEAMLKRISDVNQRNFDSMTPLHIAAIHGSTTMLKLLVQAGARIDARIPDGSSAIFFCRPELIATLLELNADIDLKNNAGQSAFVHARLSADHQRIDAFKTTGRFGQSAKVFSMPQGSTNIFSAASDGNVTALSQILELDATQLKAKEISLGESPLHFAAASGQCEVIKLLLEKGVNVNDTNDYMRTPLHYASVMGHFDAVKLLCGAKANIHALDARGATPLHDAAAAGHTKVYNYLIQLGASNSTLDNQGRSAASLLEESNN
ncbi:MAG: ankyrin repeat domain-containing protein [Candidatus Riflebacteria bacterium]|nr:ankyrin repeat domain-containing protein [Candidatus Riflebacteria bacterium]